MDVCHILPTYPIGIRSKYMCHICVFLIINNFYKIIIIKYVLDMLKRGT